MAEWQNQPLEHASRNPTTSDHAHRSTGCARGVRSAARTVSRRVTPTAVATSPPSPARLNHPHSRRRSGQPTQVYSLIFSLPEPRGRFAVRTGMEWPAVRDQPLDPALGGAWVSGP
jgi:hypothetical protein